MLRYSGHLIPYVIDGEEVMTGLLVVQIYSPEAQRIVTMLTEMYKLLWKKVSDKYRIFTFCVCVCVCVSHLTVHPRNEFAEVIKTSYLHEHAVEWYKPLRTPLK